MNDTSDSSSLQMHYENWDCFVKKWRDDEMPGVEYLPEPWWGWQPDNGELHSVTVNLRPGPGGSAQIRQSIAKVAGATDWKYSDIMQLATMQSDTFSNPLWKTEDWHFKRRYIPLMRALVSDRTNQVADTKHHLSIELLPTHHNGPISGKFPKAEKKLIDNTLLFAAKASKLITHPKGSDEPSPLKNIVIVRSAISNIEDMAGDFLESKPRSIPLQDVPFSISLFTLSKDKYSEVSDVWFVCLWGAYNNLPGERNMKRIINHINTLKKQRK